MSSKRAKSESSNSQLGGVFHKYDLVGCICAFVPSTQLPNVKATTKEAVRAIDNHESLSERWKRGVLEKYEEHRWFFNRARAIRAYASPPTRPVFTWVNCFTVCWICHGTNERHTPSLSVNNWFAKTSADTIICMPCRERDVSIKCARSCPMTKVEEDIAQMRKLIEKKMDYGTRADRIIVKSDKRYDPKQHFKALRIFFPD